MGHWDRVSALGIAALKAAESHRREPQVWFFSMGPQDELRDDVDWIEGKGRYAPTQGCDEDASAGRAPASGHDSERP